MPTIEWTIDAEYTSAASTPPADARINWSVEADFSVNIPPIDGRMRVVVVDAFGNTYGELENAVVSAVTYSLNRWETANFTMKVSDPKVSLIMEERLREVQIWRGDQLLMWGPMVRPQLIDDTLTVAVNGAMWHLSRRYVGKANRDNHLCNPSFEQNLTCWNFLRTAWYLNYEQLHTYDVRIYRPGIDGDNALEINADHQDWETFPWVIGTGTYATHEVVSGDTLWGIAKNYYGSGTEWGRIYDANQAQIQADAIAAGLWNPKDPGHWIFPGQMLTIPEVPASQAVELPPEQYREWVWGDVFGYQEFDVEGGERGLTATMAGWVKVPTAQFEDWPSAGMGLTLTRMPLDWRTNNFLTETGLDNGWGGARAFYSDPIESASSPLTEGHPFDGWIRHEVSITIPPGAHEKLIARVNGVSGRTYWDRLTLTYDTAFERFDTDQAYIVRDLVEEAQDPAWDKNDVNISADTRGTGVKRDLVALHQEHPNFWDLITEFTQYRDGLDISMVYTPTERILRTNYVGEGGRWRHWRDLSLQFGRNVASIQWTFDGEAAASSVIVLGTGDGSDREEAASINPDAFANGLILETVQVVGPETPIELLQEIADEGLAVASQPEILIVTTFPHDASNPARNFIGRVAVGDVIPVAIRTERILLGEEIVDWRFELEGDYRIINLSINEDSTVTMTLNRRED